MSDKIRVFEAFAGYGSQAMALRRLKDEYSQFDFEVVGISEIDKYAIQAYMAVHGDTKNCGDISKINWNDVPNFDLFTYSFPCFVAGTLILTNSGFKKIENITNDDKVITHTNTFKKVVTPMHRVYNGELYTLKGMGFDEIKCTEEHPFYVRKNLRVGHEQIRNFLKPEWVKVKDLTKDYYLGVAINQNSRLPVWDGTQDKRYNGDVRSNKLGLLFTNKSFWYLMGRYVGDGWCAKKNTSTTGSGIIICCGCRNEEKLIQAFNDCNFHVVVSKQKSITRYQVMLNELCEFVQRYGYYAHGKKIDIETLNLPVDLLSAFLSGYCDSDGCKVGKLYKVSTVSRELAYGIGQCVSKAYNRPYSLYVTNPKNKTIIEGREVNQRDNYSVTWKMETDKQDKAFYENGYIWFPIIDIKHEHTICDVYNMEVETDNSYTANGVIVHNCQDISTAGFQKGFVEGSGTRSSLLWECKKAIEAKKPKYLLMENVNALCSKKFLPYLHKWMSYLDGLGYSNHAKVLNAKDYGVPQNRARLFMVSILGEYKYEFPFPFELKLRLKDVLENNVDESYYISDKTVNRMIRNNGTDDFCVDTNGCSKTICSSCYKMTTFDNYVFEPYVKQYPRGFNDGFEYRNGIIPTITTSRWQNNNFIIKSKTIRMFTTRECFRLMGVSDSDIDKIHSAGISKTQQYKMAGNSIVVDVLYHIFRKLFVDKSTDISQLTLF